MKFKTKFTLLVASCTLTLLGSFYLLSIHSANNAFTEFNQKSVVHLTSELLDDDIVEAQLLSLPIGTPISEKFNLLSTEYPQQLFMLIDNDQLIMSSDVDANLDIEYLPVEHGYQFKVSTAVQSPLIVQYNQLQLSVVDLYKTYSLFWLPKNMLSRKEQESLLMSRIADEFMISLFILSLVAAALSWVGAWYFLKPLNQLKQSFKDIEKGHLETRIEIKSKDEVADILASFNRLAAWLQGLHQQFRQMNSDLSHELRTPLNAIKSRIEAMEDGLLAMDLKQLHILAIEIDALNKLIDDLSLLSLTESKQLTLENTTVSLTNLVEELSSKYQLAASTLGLSLKTELPSNNVTLHVDGNRLRQILVNLLDNAFKYGTDGKTISISLKQTKQYTEICVTDEGKGMTHDELNNVFERFYRVQTSRTDSNSLGLGLAICKQLAERMGGSLTATSQLEKGSSFTLRLFQTS